MPISRARGGAYSAPVSADKERIDVLSKKFALAAGVAITAGSLAGAAAVPAFAHHAASVMFSPDQEVVLTGTVKGFQYSNPHSTIQILVPRGGQNIEWRIVTESPNELEKSGIDETSLQPGEKVTVRARPAKRGGTSAWLLDVKKSDGTLLSVDE
jgi:hypothetical protein